VDPFLNTVIGEYCITELIGEGGMGRVYRAVHTRLNRLAAVKVLTAASGDQTFLERFMNEAQIQSQMRDPGIAILYDFTQYRDVPVIIMEYIDGQTIQQITESTGAWPVERALPVLQALARTLGYVHSQGIVHRDFKSANIKVTPSGEVKLMDFGIARSLTAQRVTSAGFVIGSFQSLSPEQTRGEPATPASDIWAFGVLAYEMLTGSLPFVGSDAAELFSKISRATFTPPTVMKSGLPIVFEQVIRRCLRRDPQDRYRSMDELSNVLARIGNPRSAPDANPYMRRRLLLAAAVLALCAVGFFGYPIVHRMIIDASNTTPSGGGKGGTGHTGSTSTDTATMQTVTVDTFNGPAQVWQNGVKVGNTPYEFHEPFGSSVSAVLKRPGYVDLPINFDVDERSSYVFTLDRSPLQ
jgi:serine/threonine protein kinase